jgi:hypothetical protein
VVGARSCERAGILGCWAKGWDAAGFPWWCEGDLCREAEWLRSAVSQLVEAVGQACSGASVAAIERDKLDLIACS